MVWLEVVTMTKFIVVFLGFYVICIFLCLWSTIAVQLTSTPTETSNVSAFIYFDHMTVWEQKSDLPECIAGMYTVALILNIFAGILIILSFAGIVVLGEKNCIRYLRTVFTAVGCIFALVALVLSMRGTKVCNGDFTGYSAGSGSTCLLVTVLLSFMLAVVSLIREIMNSPRCIDFLEDRRDLRAEKAEDLLDAEMATHRKKASTSRR